MALKLPMCVADFLKRIRAFVDTKNIRPKATIFFVSFKNYRQMMDCFMFVMETNAKQQILIDVQNFNKSNNRSKRKNVHWLCTLNSQKSQLKFIFVS